MRRWEKKKRGGGEEKRGVDTQSLYSNILKIKLAGYHLVNYNLQKTLENFKLKIFLGLY